ncbi:MAG: hypothetical protein WA749_08585 [Gelidibacter sp.]
MNITNTESCFTRKMITNISSNSQGWYNGNISDEIRVTFIRNQTNQDDRCFYGEEISAVSFVRRDLLARLFKL